MADEARIWTDRELKDLEDRIREVYEGAGSDIEAEWQTYMQRGEKRLKRLYDAYLNAPDSEKKAALEAYQQAVRNYTFMNNRYQTMLDNVTLRLATTNQTALDYVNGILPDIYMHNFNAYVLPQNQLEGFGLNFALMDQHTLKVRLLAGEVELPYKNLDKIKDQLWNRRALNNSLLTGLLTGESMSKIAERIKPIVGNNQAAAMRNARTMVTGAENEGRLDRYKDLQSQGAVMHKVWIATPDGRVRDWHLSMDGQEVDVDSVFTDGNGAKLRYPGDPHAPGNTVYNCRCAMSSKFIGMRRSDGTIRYMPKDEAEPDLHDAQIAAEKARRESDAGVRK